MAARPADWELFAALLIGFAGRIAWAIGRPEMAYDPRRSRGVASNNIRPTGSSGSPPFSFPPSQQWHRDSFGSRLSGVATSSSSQRTSPTGARPFERPPPSVTGPRLRDLRSASECTSARSRRCRARGLGGDAGERPTSPRFAFPTALARAARRQRARAGPASVREG
jgi:hypothetical protein